MVAAVEVEQPCLSSGHTQPSSVGKELVGGEGLDWLTCCCGEHLVRRPETCSVPLGCQRS